MEEAGLLVLFCISVKMQYTNFQDTVFPYGIAGLNGRNTKANKYKFYTLTIFPEATPREGDGTL